MAGFGAANGLAKLASLASKCCPQETQTLERFIQLNVFYFVTVAKLVRDSDHAWSFVAGSGLKAAVIVLPCEHLPAMLAELWALTDYVLQLGPSQDGLGNPASSFKAGFMRLHAVAIQLYISYVQLVV